MGGSGSGEISSPETTTSTRRPYSSAEQERRRTRVYTAEEIAGNDYLSTLKSSLSTMSYEQALQNLRKQQKVLNLATLAGTRVPAAERIKISKAFAGMNANPLIKYASNIFNAMGGSLRETDPNSRYGGSGLGEIDVDLYKRLGLTPPTTKYEAMGASTRQVGNKIVTTIANPLSQQQRSRLQRLRTLSSTGALSSKQKAALSRLKSKKNAPTILP